MKLYFSEERECSEIYEMFHLFSQNVNILNLNSLLYILFRIMTENKSGLIVNVSSPGGLRYLVTMNWY